MEVITRSLDEMNKKQYKKRVLPQPNCCAAELRRSAPDFFHAANMLRSRRTPKIRRNQRTFAIWIARRCWMICSPPNETDVDL